MNKLLPYETIVKAHEGAPDFTIGVLTAWISAKKKILLFVIMEQTDT